MRRFDQNPLLTRRDIQSDSLELADVSSVFNPGAVRIDNNIYLLLRVQNRGRETFLVRAVSHDGIQFRIDSVPSPVSGLDALSQKVFHIYDPRITPIHGQLLVSLAADTDEGCRAVLTRSDDLTTLEYVGLMWDGEARNGVLFPEKIGGKYVGLVRPNVTLDGSRAASGSEIWLVKSPDMIHWQPIKPILRGRPRFWDELIGSGPPPIKTKEGWLHIYHGVATHFASVNVYQAGICLLDLDDPTVVKSRGRYNILEPREEYELIGQVPNVVFPSGLIVEDCDPDGCAPFESQVAIYYGAADTFVAVATATVGELLEACYAGNE